MISNFEFLGEYWPYLQKLGKNAEEYVFKDPNASIIRIGMLAEGIVLGIMSFEKLSIPDGWKLSNLIRILENNRFLPENIDNILYVIRKARNNAVHNAEGNTQQALMLLHMAFNLSIWYMEVYGDWGFKAPQYIELAERHEDVSNGESTKTVDYLKMIKEHEEEILTLKKDIADMKTTAFEIPAKDRAVKSVAVSESLPIDEKEKTLLSADKIRIEADVMSVVNFALQQNDIPIIRRITIVNDSKEELCDCEIRITEDSGICKLYKRHLDLIFAGKRLELLDVKLQIDVNALIQLTEIKRSSLAISLCQEETVIADEVVEVMFLPFDEWHGTGFLPELITAFVTPNHPDVIETVKKASQYLGEWTGNPSLDGYYTQDPNRVMQMIGAVFAALQSYQIVYAVSPASLSLVGQRIRLCDAVLEQKMGTCIDLTLFYASCLEAMGLHPLLITKADHIFVGCWLEDLTFSEAVQDDISLLTKKIAAGVNEAAVVECTLVTSGKDVSFDQARRHAASQLADVASFEYIIDVRRARLSGIRALPIRVNSGAGWKVTDSEAEAGRRVVKPDLLSDSITIEAIDKGKSLTKTQQWERRLLDLGLRNNLINMRLTRNIIPLLAVSLDRLEDAMSDGSEFAIKPRPLDWNMRSGDFSFETMHEFRALEKVIESEYRNKRLRSSYSETELSNALKYLYRTSRISLEENGANSLYLALGIIRWYETDRSVKQRYAPVLLIPVEMVRKSTALGYVIRLRDDDPQINVTLLEKMKHDFKIDIGGLEPLPEDDHGLDIRKIFTIIRKGIMHQKRWDLLESAYLGIFSFTQYVMWNDIRNHSDDLRQNKIVSSLMEGKLNWEAGEMTIGNYVSEDDVILPIPTDASQLFAIKESSSGKSFVLHGPPGTGKSQTITGMIGNALAKGKTVLFVAEKMAALEVVQRRLDAIGLGPFCLELHSNKANKKHVLAQLQEVSDAGSDYVSNSYQCSSMSLAEKRKKLDVYVRELHKVRENGISIFESINRYEENSSFDDLSVSFVDVAGEWTIHDIERKELVIGQLVESGKVVGHPHNHPLEHIRLTSYSQSIKQHLNDSLSEYHALLSNLEDKYNVFITLLNEKPRYSREETFAYAQIAKEALKWEDIPAQWCRAEDIGAYLNSIMELCAKGSALNSLRDSILTGWTEDFLSLDGESLLSEWECNNSKNAISRYFSNRKFLKRLKTYSKCVIQKETIQEQLKMLSDYLSKKSELIDNADFLQSDICDIYDKDRTDWNKVKALCDQTKRVSDELLARTGSDSMRRNFFWRDDIRKAALAYLEEYEKVVENEKEISETYKLDLNDRSPDWIHDQIKECKTICSHLDDIRDWISWNRISEEAGNEGLQPLVALYANGLEHDKVSGTFRKSIYKAMSIYYIDQSELLNDFSGALFNKQIQQYKELDDELQSLARQEIYTVLASKIPNFTKEASHNSEVGILQRAIRSRGRGMSIRRLFEQIPNLLPRLCPCMLMSPISVAQYLGTSHTLFDLVIFDEASQLPTCKAVGALARGKNAVIVGDPNQMPPTSFFATSQVDEDNIEQEDLESILDDCLALNMPQTHLLWHYRSKHESLIAYSNSQFYDNKLNTFPSVNDRETKVSLRHIEGVFERGKNRYNRAEAEAIIQELKKRAHDPELSQYSVGIVTFNISQQNLIDDLLTEECMNDSKLEEWAYRSAEPVFIKNLENVQGDERDVILFSISYGPDQNGKIYMNFGPLNRDGGWRRLNVAISRARYEMIVYSSLLPEQIDFSKTSARGVLALKGFLEYAGGVELPENETTHVASLGSVSGVIDQICEKLESAGYKTSRNVGKSKYKVDIGIVDKDNEDNYIAGIILDGYSYGSSKSTRDREISQRSVLEGLGWDLIRVWTMDWWDSPSREMQKILQIVKEISCVEKKQLLQVKPASFNSESGNNTPRLYNSSAQISQTAEIKKRGYEPDVYSSYRIDVSLTAEGIVNGGHYYTIQNIAKKVIEQEAPITESYLIKKILRGSGITRSGVRIQGKMMTIVKGFNPTTRYGEQIVHWSSGQEQEQYFDYRINRRDGEKRDIQDIPIVEISNAICHILYEQMSLRKEDIIRETGRAFGFARIGTNVANFISNAIEFSEKEKRIKGTDGNGFLLTDEYTGKIRNFIITKLQSDQRRSEVKTTVAAVGSTERTSVFRFAGFAEY